VKAAAAGLMPDASDSPRPEGTEGAGGIVSAPSFPGRPPAPVKEALRPRALPDRVRPEAETASALAALGAGSVAGVLFFGSQRTNAGPDRFSAYDFFVIVDAYLPFYRGLTGAGRMKRGPRLLAVANALLSPSQISLHLPDGRGGELHAKCSVITLADLRHETSEARHDHFVIGRLFQPAEILWTRDDGTREVLLEALAAAAAATYSWGRPYLPRTFDVDTYLRTLLRVSLGREVRPEPTGRRAFALHEAQRAEQLPVYRVLLESLADAGALQREASAPAGPSFPTPDPTYRLARPADALERLRLGVYFTRSKARATLRWFKYVVTFDDWLEYIRRKAERHTGQSIELTPRERAYPYLFLWPRVFRYLRHKDGPRSGT